MFYDIFRSILDQLNRIERRTMTIEDQLAAISAFEDLIPQLLTHMNALQTQLAAALAASGTGTVPADITTAVQALADKTAALNAQVEAALSPAPAPAATTDTTTTAPATDTATPAASS